MKTVQVNLNERVVLLHRGVPQTALGPGRHRFWRAELSELRFNTDQVLLSAAAEVRALLPAAWFADVLLQAHERALIYRDEKPVAYLRPGAHRYWTLDASVRLRRLDVREAMPSFTAEELALLPRAEVLEATVSAHERGLLLENGRFVQSLLPGLYRFWQTPDIRTQVQTVDMRRRNVTLSGQELMTRDKVTLRVTLSIEYSVVDERRACEQLADLDAAVYQAAQLALRDSVSGLTLDGLLEARAEVSRGLEEVVAPKLGQVGLTLLSIGVKDLILPGEMKTLLNRVLEAEKEAAANVILRREEVAATRSLSNTARMMAEQPILLRLKELDALRDIAQHINEVRVVVGAESLATLLPAHLLSAAGPAKPS